MIRECMLHMRMQQPINLDTQVDPSVSSRVQYRRYPRTSGIRVEMRLTDI